MAPRKRRRPPVGTKNPREKVAVVGFTSHRALTPFMDNDWVIAGLNDLYMDLPAIPNERLEWWQIHDWSDGQPVDSTIDLTGGPVHPRDPNHVAWLAEASKRIPLYFLKAREEVPDAIVLDREAMFQYFSLDGVKPMTYFTNSISWMIGHYIMQGYKTIGVFGVDMMMGGNAPGSEYGWQRPSCEFFIGWARAAGITIVLPDESDLCKSAFPYGDTSGNPFRKKLQNHLNELKNRKAGVDNQAMQMRMAQAELGGALNLGDWITRSWLPGDGEPMLGRAPQPNADKEVAEIAAEG